jgi:hypothetical protein
MYFFLLYIIHIRIVSCLLTKPKFYLEGRAHIRSPHFPSVMPSHTASSALIKLFSCDGAPWQWPAWQERTGILHGLFPDDNSKLPKGWTRKDAVDIQSYFRAYHLLLNEDKKLAFAVNADTL